MLVAQMGKLEEALRQDGGHTVGDVLELVQRGDAQLWESDRAVIVTQVHDYPRQRVLHFWLAGGELGPVLALSERVMEWGREVGCTRATLTGRRGWERVLASEGWEAEQTLMGRGL